MHKKKTDDIKVQKDCFKRQNLEAKKMKTFTEALLVSLVPTIDHRLPNFNNIVGVLFKVKNDVYHIVTTNGYLK